MDEPIDLTSLAKHFSDEDKARELIEKLRWKNGVVCPHCTAERVYKIVPKKGSKTRKGLYKCGACRKQFTVTVGTIFESSRIPLNTWLLAFHLICSSKKGISAHQLHRMLQITYKTAWFMAHRIRYAMSQEPMFTKLNGVVEADEAYIGGSITNMHEADKKRRGISGRGLSKDKAPVVTLVERDGRVKTHHMEHVTSANIKRVLRECVHREAHLMTDEAHQYRGANRMFFGHDTVNHSAKEYVRDIHFHINTAESVHALLKRGVTGVYHHWSKKHLHRYLTEFDFRWNHRKVLDGERTVAAIKGVEGKRLMYRDSSKH